MDDLIGLDWDSSKKPTSTSTPTLRPNPTATISGRSTPSIIRPSSTSTQPSLKIGSRTGTPANDSFASLLAGNAKQTSSLSLQERQRQLQEEKAKRDASWNSLGGQNGQQQRQSTFAAAPIQKSIARQNNDDILAAFNASAPVDSSSHFPPPRSIPTSQSSTPLKVTKDQGAAQLSLGDDDDPFGLNSLPRKPSHQAAEQSMNNDDDILGMLGRPVEEVRSLSKSPSPQPRVNESVDTTDLRREDKAVSELVDMGFSPDQAAIALARTDSGYDVQAAIGILLNEAHSKSKSHPQSKSDAPNTTVRRDGCEEREREPARDDAVPPWMKSQDNPRSSSKNRDQTSGKDKDVTQLASEIGTSLFKSANSLWKTGQKKVQRAVADLQQDGDSNQPKWMRDAQLSEKSQSQPSALKSKIVSKAPMQQNMTDEAIMLEAREERQSQIRQQHDRETSRDPLPEWSSRSTAPIDRKSSPLPSSQQSSRSASRLTRQDLETESVQAYVSPARRRKPQVSPQPVAAAQPTPNLPGRVKSPLASPPLQSNNPFANVTTKPPSKSSSSTPRPKAPRRHIPPASSAAVSTSASYRQKGSEAYKRGDFSSAHASYTSALQSIPSNHPVAIVILCNRSLTNIKVGDPKAAIVDANSALEIVGISRGDGEKINLGPGEGEKEMKEFYGKALMRKAEALENMEKWNEAAKVWRQAVEAGVGGSISIQGRNRCEKAIGVGTSSQAPRPKPKAKPAPKPRVSALDALSGKRPSVNHVASAEAVRKLREANAAADKADDEKFALMDSVDAKLIAWKGTKADNLRALLGSLDKVLWADAGWNKVGMQDLVMPNRVKIVYMKAIAKVHPDKISSNATTEQRMISAAVFSTLNEAWDKFKADNNL